MLFPLSRYEDSVLIVLSIFEDFGYFICPQTGIGLNSSVHSMGSILHSWPVNTPWTPLNTFSLNTSENRKSLYFKGFSGVFTSTFQFDNLTGSPEHIVHIDGVVGSSPTVTTTNPVGVQVQRLPDFFAYPSRVRTFRSQEYALFCQRGMQKGTQITWKLRTLVGYSFTSTNDR